MKTSHFSIFGIVLIFPLLFAGAAAYGQGYQPVTPLFTQEDMPKAGRPSSSTISVPMLNGSGQMQDTPLNVMVDQAVGKLLVNWPGDSISSSQLSAIAGKFPAAQSMQLLFPNQTQLSVSPKDIIAMHGQYLKQAAQLGFGQGGGSIPELIITSLAQQAGIDASGLRVPIAAIQQDIKQGMSDAIEPMLRELRYQQLSLFDWIPGWLKDWILASWNVLISCYYTAMGWFAAIWDWVMSLF